MLCGLGHQLGERETPGCPQRRHGPAALLVSCDGVTTALVVLSLIFHPGKQSQVKDQEGQVLFVGSACSGGLFCDSQPGWLQENVRLSSQPPSADPARNQRREDAEKTLGPSDSPTLTAGCL